MISTMPNLSIKLTCQFMPCTRTEILLRSIPADDGRRYALFQTAIFEHIPYVELKIGRFTPQKENQYSVVKERGQKRIRNESEAIFFYISSTS